jgi:uncharacterized protein YecE (DUF72 family)
MVISHQEMLKWSSTRVQPDGYLHSSTKLIFFMFVSDSHRKVVQGICGWSDASLLSCKRFFPPKTRTSPEKLAFMPRSGVFGCVEVDSSTYNIPLPSTVKSWVDATPKGFVFHVKAFGLLCGTNVERNQLPREFRDKFINASDEGKVRFESLSEEAKGELWRLFNEAIAVAKAEDKLGFIVFQFQTNFLPSSKSKAYLQYCAEHLRSDCPIVVDFRAREWISPDQLKDTVVFLRHLRPEGVLLAASDDLAEEMHLKDLSGVPIDSKRRLPILLTSFPSSMAVYVRIHRRVGSQRVLAEEEIQEWADRIVAVLNEKSVEKPVLCGPVFVMWATDYQDQPVINAKNLTKQLPGDLLFDPRKLLRGSGSSGTIHSFFSRASVQDKTQVTTSSTTTAELFYPQLQTLTSDTFSSPKKRSQPADDRPVSPSKSKRASQSSQSASRDISSYFYPKARSET